MIKHIVMWKFKPEAEGKSRLENMEIVRELLYSLPPKISVIKKMEIGFDVAMGEGMTDLCLITEFESLDTLKEYAVHPEHVKVGECVRKVVESRQVVDFEF